MKKNVKILLIVIAFLAIIALCNNSSATSQIPTDKSSIAYYNDLDDYWIVGDVSASTFWAKPLYIDDYTEINYMEYQQNIGLRYFSNKGGLWTNNSLELRNCFVGYYDSYGTRNTVFKVLTTNLYGGIESWGAKATYTSILENGYNEVEFWVYPLQTTGCLEYRVRYNYPIAETVVFQQSADSWFRLGYTLNGATLTYYTLQTYTANNWYHVRILFQSNVGNTNVIGVVINGTSRYSNANLYSSYTNTAYESTFSNYAGQSGTSAYFDAVDQSIDVNYFVGRNKFYENETISNQSIIFMKESQYFSSLIASQFRVDENECESIINENLYKRFFETIYINKTSGDFHYLFESKFFKSGNSLGFTMDIMAWNGLVRLTSYQSASISFTLDNGTYVVNFLVGFSKIDSGSPYKVLISYSLKNVTGGLIYHSYLDEPQLTTNIQNIFLKEKLNNFGYMVNESELYNVSGAIFCLSNFSTSYDTIRVGEIYRYLSETENLYISQYYFTERPDLFMEKFFAEQEDYGFNGTNPYDEPKMLPGWFLPAFFSYPYVHHFNPVNFVINNIIMIDVGVVFQKYTLTWNFPAFAIKTTTIPFWIGGFNLTIIRYFAGGWANPINWFVWLANVLLAGMITVFMFIFYLVFNGLMFILFVLYLFIFIVVINFVCYWILWTLLFLVGWFLWGCLWLLVNMGFIISIVVSAMIWVFSGCSVNYFIILDVVYAGILNIIIFTVSLVQYIFAYIAYFGISLVLYFTLILFLGIKRIIPRTEDVIEKKSNLEVLWRILTAPLRWAWGALLKLKDFIANWG